MAGNVAYQSGFVYSLRCNHPSFSASIDTKRISCDRRAGCHDEASKCAHVSGAMMMSSFDSPAKAKKRPLPSPPQRQLSPPWPQSAESNAAERLSPTHAFKRLRVSEELQARSPSFFAQAKSDRWIDQCESSRVKHYGEGSGGKLAAATSNAGSASTFPHGSGAAAGDDDDELAEEECYSYSPVNHLLGDLHRQRLIRREIEAQQSQPSLLESSPYGGRQAALQNTGRDNSHPIPLPAGRNRKPLKLFTDSKLE